MKGMSDKVRKIIERVLLTALAICLFIPGMTIYAQQSSDISGHWAEKTLNEWLEKDYITGYGDGTVRPNQNVTRAELFAIVNRVFGFTDTADIQFRDVKKSDWYYTPIAAAVQAGYAEGYQDDTMKPNSKVTRQEVATIIARLLGLENLGTASKFKDADNIAAWASGYVSGVREYGIMTGYSDSSFKPLSLATRAEAVVSLQQAAQVRDGLAQYSSAQVFGPEQGMLTIEGDAMIAVSGVTLQNAVVKGNLLLSESIGEGDVFLNNVTVEGTLSVEGGGSESIHVADSHFNQVVIKKKGNKVRMAFRGNSKIDVMSVQSALKIEKEGSGASISFGEVELEEMLPEGTNVELEGRIGRLNIHASETRLQMNKGEIDELEVGGNSEGCELEIHENTTIRKAVFNGPANVGGKGRIEDLTVNADGVSVEQAPNKMTVREGVRTTIAGETKTSADNTSPQPTLPMLPGTSNPSVPVGNVTGTIVFKEGGAPIASGVVVITKAGSPETNWSVKVTNGKFDLQLPDGDYSVASYRYTDGGQEHYGNIRMSFTVSGSKTLKLTVPRLYAVQISVKSADNTPVGLSYMEIYYKRAGTDDKISLSSDMTNSTGIYDFSMPEGDYVFESIYSSEGKLQFEPVQKTIGPHSDNQVEIKLFAYNFTVKDVRFADNDEPVDNGTISVFERYGIELYSLQIKNGKLSGYLPDGEYLIQGYSYRLEDGIYRSSNFYSGNPVFTVKDGVADFEKLVFSRLYQVRVAALNDGEAISDGAITITNGIYTITMLNLQMQINQYMPAGEYTVTSVEDHEGRQWDTKVKFEVGSNDNNKVTINLPDDAILPNVTGSIEFDDGTSIESGWVSIKSDESQMNYDARVTDGKFGIHLPEGIYLITSYSYNRDGIHFSDLLGSEYRFSVTEDVAEIQLVVPKSYKWEIILKDSEGAPVVVPNFSLNLQNHHILITFNADHDHPGLYYAAAVAGTYEIRELLSVPFSITPVEATIGPGLPNRTEIIMLPNNMRTVEIEVAGGTSVLNGVIFVYKLGESEALRLIIQNGELFGYLPDGEYRLSQYVYEDEDGGIWSGSFSSENQQFTVSDGLPNLSSITLPSL